MKKELVLILQICSNDDSFNDIEPITQTNDAIVGDDTVQSNFVGVVQDMQLENVCDETGVGDNSAECDNDERSNSLMINRPI